MKPIVIIGSLQAHAYIGSVDWICPCINAASGMGGGQTPVIVYENETEDKLNSKTIYEMAKIYRIRKLTPKECLRLMAVTDHDIDLIQHYPYVQSADGSWVLPDGMTETDAKKLKISESQQYKMAGNSIVVNVLEGIFTQLFRLDSDSLF